MGVEENILTTITGGFVFVMGAALWCGGEHPYCHYWRFCVCDGSRTVGMEEDILTAITGGFVFVMGAGLWMWRRISLLPLLDVLCL